MELPYHTNAKKENIPIVITHLLLPYKNLPEQSLGHEEEKVKLFIRMRWCGGVNQSRSGAFRSQVSKSNCFLPTFNSVLVLLSDKAWLLQFWKTGLKRAWERSSFTCQLWHIKVVFSTCVTTCSKVAELKMPCTLHLQLPSIHWKQSKRLSLQTGCTQPLSQEQFVWKGCRWQTEQDEEPSGQGGQELDGQEMDTSAQSQGWRNSCPPFLEGCYFKTCPGNDQLAQETYVTILIPRVLFSHLRTHALFLVADRRWLGEGRERGQRSKGMESKQNQSDWGCMQGSSSS